MFWIDQKVHPVLTRGLDVHHTKALRLNEHTNNGAPHHVQARLRSTITIHVSSNRSPITRRISRRWLFSRAPI
jgi:hypothetical protein